MFTAVDDAYFLLGMHHARRGRPCRYDNASYLIGYEFGAVSDIPLARLVTYAKTPPAPREEGAGGVATPKVSR